MKSGEVLPTGSLTATGGCVWQPTSHTPNANTSQIDLLTTVFFISVVHKAFVLNLSKGWFDRLTTYGWGKTMRP
jgi:hypothetical protein